MASAPKTTRTFLERGHRHLLGTTAIGCVLKGHHTDPHDTDPLRICQQQCQTANPLTSVEVSGILDNIIKLVVMPSEAYEQLEWFRKLQRQNKHKEASAAMEAAILMIESPLDVMCNLACWVEAVNMDVEAAIVVASPWVAQYWEVLWRGRPPAESLNTPAEIARFLFTCKEHLGSYPARLAESGYALGIDIQPVFAHFRHENALTISEDSMMYVTKGPYARAIMMMDAVAGGFFGSEGNFPCRADFPGRDIEDFVQAYEWPRDDPRIVWAHLRFSKRHYDGSILECMGFEARDDRLVVQEAGPYELIDASQRMRNDPETVLGACVSFEKGVGETPWYKSLRWDAGGTDVDKLPPPRILVSKGDITVLRKYAARFMKYNDDFARTMILADRRMYVYASDAVRHDRALLLNMAYNTADRPIFEAEYEDQYMAFMDVIPVGFNYDHKFLVELIRRDFNYFPALVDSMQANEELLIDLASANVNVIYKMIKEDRLTVRAFQAYQAFFVRLWKGRDETLRQLRLPWTMMVDHLEMPIHEPSWVHIPNVYTRIIVHSLYSTVEDALGLLRPAVHREEAELIASFLPGEIRNDPAVLSLVQSF